MRRCLLIVLVCLSACRDEASNVDVDVATATPDSVVWGDDRDRRGERGGSPDRRFLEHLLDHYQGLEYLAERIRQTSTVTAVRRDAWRFDQQGAAERQEVDALLHQLYDERYLPLVPEEFRLAAVTIRELPPEQQARALLEFVNRHQQEDVARFDRILPSLEHPEVRELARELRRDQRRDLRVFARRLARD
jgi:uncharacterized protein (DUF305 family)